MDKFSFAAAVCDGNKSTVERDGFTLTATIYADDDNTPPWERNDGHGPVSDWRCARFEGDGKEAGERVLNRDRHSARFYDFAKACKIALRDGWGVEGGQQLGETPKAYAARAAEADFERLRAWCNDEWSYVGVAVVVSRAGVDLTEQYAHALWGIESDSGAYLAETAEELAAEVLSAARAKIAELCTCSEPAKEEPEAREFAFDVKLFASIRVKATTEEGARAQLRQLLDCASVVIEPLDGNHDFSDLQRFECSADGEADLVEVEDEDSQA